MLSHATSKVIDKAVLVTGDLDFRPVVEALVQIGVIVELVYDPLATAAELQSAADIRRPITLEMWRDFSTRQFQKLHSLPRIFSGFLHQDRRQLKTGLCQGHGVRVWELTGGEFAVELEGFDEVNNLSTFIQGADLDFILQKYIPMSFGPISMTTEAEAR